MTAVDLDALDNLRGAAVLAVAHAAVGPEDGPGWADVTVDVVFTVPEVRALIAEARKYRALRDAMEGLAEKFDRPVAGITLGGIPQRALFGGGDVCYRLRAVVATVDGEQ